MAAATTGADGACLALAGAGTYCVGTAKDRSPVCEDLARLVAESGAVVLLEDASAELGVGAAAGVAVSGPDGAAAGSLSVVHSTARAWTDSQVASLQALAAWAGSELGIGAWREEAASAQVLLGLALDAAGIGTFDLDLTTGTVRWDDAMFAMFGADRATFEGRLDEAYERIHPDDLERVQREVDEAVAAGEGYATSYRVVLPTGAVRHLAARGRCLNDPAGRPWRLLGAAFDVTDRWAAERRVEEAMRNLIIGYLSMDTEWRITYVNVEGSRVLGRSAADLVGRVLWDVFPTTLGTGFEQTYRRAAATGEAESFDAWYPAPLNTWFEIRVIPSPDGVALCFLDVTERHQAQAEAEATARRTALLAEVTARLAGTVDPTAAVATLAELVVPELADWCTITRLQGRLPRTEGWAHADPAQAEALAAYAADQARDMTDTAPVAVSLRTGAEVVVAQVPPVDDWVADPASRARLARLAPRSVAVLPLAGRASTVAAMALVRTGERPPIDETELETAREIAHRAGLALENAQLRNRARLLAAVTERLTGTIDAEEAVGLLAQLVVPTLGDWSIVTMVDHEQRPGTVGLRDVGYWHRDERRRPVVRAYAGQRLSSLTPGSFLLRALSSGETVVVEEGAAGAVRDVLHRDEARTLIEELAPGSLAVVPLRARDRTVGLVSVYGSTDRGPLSADELRLAGDIAGRAALALDNARLYREQRDLAEGLQRSLLTDPEPLAHLHTVARYRAAIDAAQVGGDWYDAFAQADGGTVFVVGDVMGHDTVAAAAMGQLRTVVRTIGSVGDDGPARILRQSDVVSDRLGARLIASAVVARLPSPDADLLRWSNAGHPPPVVIRTDGSVATLENDPADLLLGVVPGFERSEWATPFPPGSTLILYTDGLVERRGQPLDDGVARLVAAAAEVAGMPLDALVDELLARMLPDRPEDDVVVLAVRRPDLA